MRFCLAIVISPYINTNARQPFATEMIVYAVLTVLCACASFATATGSARSDFNQPCDVEEKNVDDKFKTIKKMINIAKNRKHMQNDDAGHISNRFFASDVEEVKEEEFAKEVKALMDEFIETGKKPELFDQTCESVSPEVDEYAPRILGKTLLPTLTCIFCRETANSIIFARRTLHQSRRMLRFTALALCNALTRLKYPQVCSGLIDQNIDIIIYIVDNNPNVDGTKICSLALQDRNCFPKEFEPFSIDIPPQSKSLPVNDESTKKGEPNYRVIHITDPHYDPEYKIGSNAECGLPLCCQGEKADKAKSEAGLWGDYRQCDAPFHLINNSFYDILTNHGTLDYIYYTGDVVAHKVWSTSIQSNADAITDLFGLMREYFASNVPLFPILGNHDPHPLNVYAPHGLPDQFSTQWLYDYIAEEWKAFLPEDALETVKFGGFYTVVPKQGFRIIALNNNVAYIYNWWILLNHGDMYGQLKWLVETLQLAEQNNEAVHILAHILPGDPTLFKHWGTNFRKIVQRFHKTIKAIFYGHTHYDEFSLYFDNNDLSKGLVPAFNGGSLTPYEFLNINYKIYSVDSNNYEILDYEQWIFDLIEANTNLKEPRWTMLYSFRDAYSVGDMKPQTLADLIERMPRNKELTEKYERFKVKDAAIHTKKTCDTDCHTRNLCDIVNNDYFDRRKCNSMTNIYKENNK